MSGNPSSSKDPEVLIKMPMIPVWRFKYLKGRLGPPSRTQQQDIRRLLNMHGDQPFAMCRGRNWKFIRTCEAKGDMSHSGKKHVCEECACRHTAGTGVKGDFYGLGPETGTLGLGYCKLCADHLHVKPATALSMARREFELVRRYGAIKMNDKEYSLKLANEENALVEQRRVVREEMSLVVDTLAEFKKQLDKDNDEKQPTEMTGLGPVPMCDKTKIQLKLDIAKVLNKFNFDAFKMDADNYIHLDEIFGKGPEMRAIIRRALSKVHEMDMAKAAGEPVETEDDPVEYAWSICQKEWDTMWRTVKKGRRQRG